MFSSMFKKSTGSAGGDAPANGGAEGSTAAPSKEGGEPSQLDKMTFAFTSMIGSKVQA